MKRITSLSVALIGAILLTTDQSADPGGGVGTGWEYGNLVVDIPGLVVPCLEETLRVVADWPIRSREIWTPSGGYHFAFQYPPATPSNGGHYLLIGESTGRIYYSQNGMPAHDTIHLGPGEVYRWRSHERYVSNDGIRLMLDQHIIYTVNANGELVTEVQIQDCKVQ
jgi:hypothetical protein